MPLYFHPPRVLNFQRRLFVVRLLERPGLSTIQRGVLWASTQRARSAGAQRLPCSVWNPCLCEHLLSQLVANTTSLFSILHRSIFCLCRMHPRAEAARPAMGNVSRAACPVPTWVWRETLAEAECVWPCSSLSAYEVLLGVSGKRPVLWVLWLRKALQLWHFPWWCWVLPLPKCRINVSRCLSFTLDSAKKITGCRWQALS